MKTRTTHLALILLLAIGVTAGCSENRTEAQAATKQKPRFETVVIPDGASVIATLDALITTERNRTGDTFTITTVDPIMVGDKTAVPAGTRINGVLRDVAASGRTSGRARLTLAYLGMVDNEGKTHTISARTLSLEADSHTHTDVERIAAGGVLGAIVGGIAGGTKGAAIGAGAGAGAGAVVMLATQGDEVVLPAGQRLIVHMTSPTSIQVLARN
jgi:hypothetical protein